MLYNTGHLPAMEKQDCVSIHLLPRLPGERSYLMTGKEKKAVMDMRAAGGTKRYPMSRASRSLRRRCLCIGGGMTMSGGADSAGWGCRRTHVRPSTCAAMTGAAVIRRSFRVNGSSPVSARFAERDSHRTKTRNAVPAHVPARQGDHRHPCPHGF